MAPDVNALSQSLSLCKLVTLCHLKKVLAFISLDFKASSSVFAQIDALLFDIFLNKFIIFTDVSFLTTDIRYW